LILDRGQFFKFAASFYPRSSAPARSFHGSLPLGDASSSINQSKEISLAPLITIESESSKSASVDIEIKWHRQTTNRLFLRPIKHAVEFITGRRGIGPT